MNGKLDAWIFDLDGTLADIEHRRHHVLKSNKSKDYDTFYKECVNDKPILAVGDVFRNLPVYDRRLIVSGRSKVVEDATHDWLLQHNLWPERMWMREIGDTRPDVELKLKWYKEEIEPQYNILGVFEDRTRLVQMWRSLGLTCFQVADGNF